MMIIENQVTFFGEKMSHFTWKGDGKEEGDYDIKIYKDRERNDNQSIPYGTYKKDDELSDDQNDIFWTKSRVLTETMINIKRQNTAKTGRFTEFFRRETKGNNE